MLTKEFRLKMIMILTRSLVDAENEGDSKAFFIILAQLKQEMAELNRRKELQVDNANKG